MSTSTTTAADPLRTIDRAAELLDWIERKTTRDLQAIEVGGRNLYPDVIRWRDAKGRVVERPCLLRVPDLIERAKATAEAAAWLARLKLDRERDARHFDNLETMCLVARATREAREPYEQHKVAEDFAATYGARTVLDLWERINLLDRAEDPRVHTLRDGEADALIHAIAKRLDLGPLAGIASEEQDSFVTSMAVRLSRYLTSAASASSPESSTQAPSDATS